VNAAAADILILGIFVGDCNMILFIRVRAASMSTPTEKSWQAARAQVRGHTESWPLRYPEEWFGYCHNALVPFAHGRPLDPRR